MEAIFEAFGIDWKLLFAQLLNFGILAFLLTKFLFRPMFAVLNARAEKAKDIEDGAREVADARANMEQRSKEQEAAARAKADTILREATEMAEVRRKEILAKADEEAGAVRDRASREIAQERARVLDEAQAELAGLALFAAERVLGREVNRDDTERLVREAVNEMPRL